MSYKRKRSRKPWQVSKKQNLMGEVMKCPEGMHEVWLYNRTWRANVHFLWPCTAEQEKAWIARVLKASVPDDWNESTAGGHRSVTWDGFDASIISLVKFRGTPYDVANLAHECLHTVEHILFKRGMKHTPETSEAFTYLLATLVEQFLDAVRSMKR